VKSKSIKRVVTYTRVSTWDQMSDDDGNRKDDATSDMHRIRCHKHIKHLSSVGDVEYRIIDDISDEGFTGTNTKRPGYQDLLARIARKEIDFVITTELSRLSRSVIDFLDLVSHCEKNNVGIIIMGMQLDTSTPYGRFVTVILVAMAQFESQMTGTRVKANVATRLIKEGKINGASELLGLVRDPSRKGHFIVDPDGLKKAEHVLTLFLKFSSKTKVHEELKRLGLTGVKGKQITVRMIDYILENAKWRYRGLWYSKPEHRLLDLKEIPPGDLVKLDHGSILKEKLLDDVILKLADTKQKNKKCGSKGYIYLLSNLLIDGENNAYKGRSSHGGQYRYYEHQVTKVGVRVDEIEPLILKRVKEYFANSPLFEKLLLEALNKKKSQTNIVEQKICSLELELSSIADKEMMIREKFLSSEMEDETLEFFKESVQIVSRQKNQKVLEIKHLKESLVTLKDDSALQDLRRLIKDYANKFDQLSGTQQRNLLEKLISKIVLKDGVLEIQLTTNGSGADFKGIKKAVTEDGFFMDYSINGGRDETRTRGLLRDRQTL
jgi:DNA invertase Pin-like site-specific DNA recombinase